ncbi:MAG: calcium-binding protein [Burkholderiales bacterium]|nr:calcium-binding protein [Burkholderiales bacterium]
MALLSAGLNFSPLIQPQWTTFSVSGWPDNFQMWDNLKAQYFSGSFTYPDTTHVRGTVNSLTLTYMGTVDLDVTVSGLSLDAATVQTKVIAGSGLYAYLLSGDDTIEGGKVLAGYDGNDRLKVQFRFDGVGITADGGNGIDTVQFNLATNASLLSHRAVGVDFGGSAPVTLTNVENLTGSNYADTLAGDAGNNVLSGGGGIDTASFAAVTTVSVTANLTAGTATGQGSDTLVSIENLTGGQLGDTLTGNAGANRLDGGKGSDTMRGGQGNDTYVVDSSTDVVSEAADGGSDTIETGLSWTLSQAFVEHLTLTGSAINGIGNTAANRIAGNAQDNLLDGRSGADTMTGGLGNDRYIIDNAGDSVVEAKDGGIDTVQSSVSKTLAAYVENLTLTGSAAINATGNSEDNLLIGNTAANVLTTGGGVDTLRGGGGDDTYVLSAYSWATISETWNGGHDTVKSHTDTTLAAYVEDLVMLGSDGISGTGNSSANRITGNSSNNTLDGRAGSDTLIGGAGNDVYIVDRATDVVTEGVGGGYDEVHSSSSFTLGANIERLALTGSASVHATGNAGSNDLFGNSGNNRLDGAAGTDFMAGGLGNDTYVVDNLKDVVSEEFDSGTDTVLSSVSWTVGYSIENVTLTGSAAVHITETLSYSENNRLTGNSGANTLTARYGDDTLNGGAGADTLRGGDGRDRFDFSHLDAADVLADFNGSLDLMAFDALALQLGDADRVIDGAVSQSHAGQHGSDAELVIAEQAIGGSITAASVAAAIGSATDSYAVGDSALFVVHNSSDSAVYLFRSAGNDAAVSTSELTRLVWLEGHFNPLRIDDFQFIGG